MRRLARDLTTPEPGDRHEGADPGSGRGKQDIGDILRVTDHREGGKKVPDRAPMRGQVAVPRAHSSVEEDIGGICCRCTEDYTGGDQRIHRPGQVEACAAAGNDSARPLQLIEWIIGRKLSDGGHVHLDHGQALDG